MLDLASEQWRSLEHAYGAASDIPGLLVKLASYPPYNDYRTEPYFSLWNKLCHQSDIFTASYAAVPHILQFAAKSPDAAHWDLVLLPTSIEIARLTTRGPALLPEFEEAYLTAISTIPSIVAAMQRTDSSQEFASIAAAGIAISCGHAALAESILELTPDVVPEFLEWVHNR